GNPIVLALTATATQAVVEDIRKQLGRRELFVVDLGVVRPNLRYAVVRTSNELDKRSALSRFLADENGPGIVYCSTVRDVEAVFAALKHAGESVVRYHGRLPARERTESQDRFMAGGARGLVGPTTLRK